MGRLKDECGLNREEEARGIKQLKKSAWSAEASNVKKDRRKEYRMRREED
jgi:hypothetical protein